MLPFLLCYYLLLLLCLLFCPLFLHPQVSIGTPEVQSWVLFSPLLFSLFTLSISNPYPAYDLHTRWWLPKASLSQAFFKTNCQCNGVIQRPINPSHLTWSKPNILIPLVLTSSLHSVSDTTFYSGARDSDLEETPLIFLCPLSPHPIFLQVFLALLPNLCIQATCASRWLRCRSLSTCLVSPALPRFNPSHTHT